MLFFYGVVGGEVRAELETSREELYEREVLGTFVIFAGCVEEGPTLAEMIMLFQVSVKSSRSFFSMVRLVGNSGDVQNTPYALP